MNGGAPSRDGLDRETERIITGNGTKKKVDFGLAPFLPFAVLVLMVFNSLVLPPILESTPSSCGS